MRGAVSSDGAAVGPFEASHATNAAAASTSRGLKRRRIEGDPAARSCRPAEPGESKSDVNGLGSYAIEQPPGRREDSGTERPLTIHRGCAVAASAAGSTSCPRGTPPGEPRSACAPLETPRRRREGCTRSPGAHWAGRRTTSRRRENGPIDAVTPSHREPLAPGRRVGARALMPRSQVAPFRAVLSRSADAALKGTNGIRVKPRPRFARRRSCE